jgi:GT2 family glycosyltransferase
MTGVTVSAIVCTFDRPDMMEGCLTSLAAALDPGDEIVVVEAGDSSVATALEAARFAQRVVHVRARPGKSHQLNLGVGCASGRFLLLTDDDVRISPGWRDSMVECFSDPAVGMVCGRVDGLHYGPERPPGAAEEGPFEAPFESWTYAHGALMGLRAHAAWHVGGHDERLGPGAPAHGEEHDLLLRMRERGWKVMIVPDAPARHLEWRDEAASNRNAVVYERGGGAFVGAALRRSAGTGRRVLGRRFRYQLWLFTVNWKFALKALVAFAGGLLYGVRLSEREWLIPGGDEEVPCRR